MRRIFAIVISLLIIFLVFCGIFFLLDSKDNSGEFGTYSYSVSDCDLGGSDLFRYKGINDVKWLSGDTLFVKVTTGINCAADIGEAYLERDKNELFLSYVIEEDGLAQCICSKSIEYEIRNLSFSEEYLVRFKDLTDEYEVSVHGGEVLGLNKIPYISDLKIIEFENTSVDEKYFSDDSNGINTLAKSFEWVDNSTLNVTALFELNCFEELEEVDFRYSNHYKMGDMILVYGYYSPENNFRTDYNGASGKIDDCRKVVEANFLLNDFENKSFEKIVSFVHDID